ncbi:hypothetical protein NKH48_27655 [Mesorhizobium sp. M1233]|uniref:hypothetical protein n=1 Tax=Mesorhizobium sp. M1233 TaxID=2957072 RepID=UPI0033352969
MALFITGTHEVTAWDPAPGWQDRLLAALGTASLQHGDTTQFVPNMTMHMICGMYEEKDIGCVLSETFLVTENGVERLAKTPRELFVNE